MVLSAEKIPQEIQSRGRFCLWRYEDKDGRKTKMPYSVTQPGQRVNGEKDSPAYKAHFGSFSEALSLAGQSEILCGFPVDGLGIDIGSGSTIAGIDIDHCLGQFKKPSPMAADILRIMQTYSEISPSGEGLRLFFTVPQGFRFDKLRYYIQYGGLEVYIPGMTRRYLTITGNRISSETGIPDRSAELMTVLEKYMKRKETPQDAAAPAEPLRQPVSLSDQDLIRKACESSQEFAALFSGQWESVGAGDGSHSSADLALCNYLAFWTGKDPDRMDQLFRQSGLYRPKWERSDYSSGTIQKAIMGTTEIYSPDAPTASAVFGYVDSQRGSGNDPAPVSLADIAQNAVQNPEMLESISVSEYLDSGQFSKDIEYFQEFSDRKTGFPNLDQYLTLYPGLAVLGGAASLGKSTFAINLTENLLRRGETVLYFALEQAPVELVSKMVSRRLFESAGLDPQKTKYTNLDIKNGVTGAEITAAEMAVADDVENLWVIECDFQLTADDIAQTVDRFTQEHPDKKPVVIIDYLQLLAPARSVRATDQRTQIDYSVKRLKSLQREHGLLIIMISNFNRSAYNLPVGYESFKESGLIEFTCDYVWGLQLGIVGEPRFFNQLRADGSGRTKTAATTPDQKSMMIYEASREMPKRVQFVSLKSRNGKQSYKVNFKYWMQYDYFQEDQENPADPLHHVTAAEAFQKSDEEFLRKMEQMKADPDGWNPT